MAASMTGVVGAVVAWGGLVWRFATFGLSTVPGFLGGCTRSPRSASSASARSREQVLFLGAVVAAIPFIWVTEWVGGHSRNGAAATCSCRPRCSSCSRRRRSGRLGLAAAGRRRRGSWRVDERRRRRVGTSNEPGRSWTSHRTSSLCPATSSSSATSFWMGARSELVRRPRWLAAASTTGNADDAEVAAAVELARQGGAERIDVIDSPDHPLDRLDEAPVVPGLPLRERANRRSSCGTTS